MKLSIIVIFYNMRREAARTLYTLSPAYQSGVSAADYQVIAVDNGSTEPLGEEVVARFGSNFEYKYIENALPTPARAMNEAIAGSDGELVMSIIDGARMLSPGVIRNTLMAADMFARPFLFTLGWHLGPKSQNWSMLEGYDQAEEDALLETVDWRVDGYRLFDISVLANSSHCGYFGDLPSESNCFTMKKSDYERLGGLDEQFLSSGGGLVNLDFFKRALQTPGLDPVLILGEGSFHQFHGGTATNVPPNKHPFRAFAVEYQRLRGEPYRSLKNTHIHYFGTMPPSALKFLNGRFSSQGGEER